MSEHTNKAINKASHAVNGATDRASSFGYKANDQVTKFIQSPEQRKKAWAATKRYPLTYSFLLFQLLVSFIPVSMSAGFVAFATACAAATTVVAFSLAFCVGLGLLIPILFVTVPLAAFLWACTVGTTATIDYIYRNLYNGSRLQASINKAAGAVANEYTEIEQNAIAEYEGYERRAIETGQEARERGAQMIDTVGREVKQAEKRAIEFGDNAVDRVNGYIDEGQKKVDDLVHNGTNLAKDAKHHAGNVKQKGVELKDQTKASSKGLAADAKHEFGQ